MHPIETPDKTFHDGDGVSELGTILPAWWLNQVQSELLAVLTAAGIQPDKANSGQLLEAIKKVAPKTSPATATEAGLVKLINNLTSGGTDAALTAEQGKVLADLIANAGAPSGTVIWHAGSSAPAGYLKANGAAVSRTAYAALFAAIGTTYGSGDGRTTFNLPDLRGEFIRGWDDGRGIDNGRALGSSQSDEFKSHTHGGVAVKALDSDRGGAPSLFSIDGLGQTEAAGGAETRPRNIALLACIKI